MSFISDGSTDPLLARFKVLEETVDKLHRENRSLKTKLKSYNTLSTFYHEARQQIKNLNRQLAEKEAFILKLKDGHGTAGLGGNQLEPSKSLVDSLVEQLSSMKNQLKEAERISQEKVGSLNQEIQRLHQQLEERNQKMQKMSSWPSHEKEMEIFRLHQSLAEKERVQATSEVLCRSLSDETHQLQRKLAATAEMCQQLVTCLEETHRKNHVTSEEQQNQNKDSENEAILSKLQEENRLLKQKVIHVEDLNAKWQKYDASREEYVKGLHQQLKEMKAQKEHMKSAPSVHKHPDLLQKEISRLNRLLEDKMNEKIKLQEEAMQTASARIADRERIQMLEQQLMVYKDDFTSERADRERAQSRIQELVEQISCLQKKARRTDEKYVGSQFQIQIGNQNKTYIQKKSSEPLRGLTTEHAESRRQLSAADNPERQRSPNSEHRGQDELQCPRCLEVFHDRLGENFLEHIAECCQ
ncbi:PREDICTED: TNFAIP3-interacting protein 2 [Nanorana parkeri]|uniref:TNFAIP3-interacting protein 2 n=1 Tax=Nanorana parkeri TaxID=125878 RepID=UPI0008549313|nr:PREDICTED: TNFAIP3-interacting protein 2 [Nanorana parkeri]